MIPKILHQAWIGEIDVPPDLKKWSEDLGKLNPDWRHIVWNNETTENLSKELPPLAYEKYKMWIDKKAWALALDILRYYMVYKFGGIWMDMDSKPNPSGSLNILPLEKDLILARQLSTTIRLQNCFFGSSTENRFIKNLVDRVANTKYTILSGDKSPSEVYGNSFLTTEYALKLYPKLNRETLKYSLWGIPNFKNEDVPENEIVVDRRYYRSKPYALIAQHIFLRSHDPQNIQKYSKN